MKMGDAMRLQSAWVIYFNEVAKCLSIREAARRLHVSPSAISRQIKEIEDTIGSKLLERVPHGMRLTPAGESVAYHAARMLENLDRMKESIDELWGLRRGHVRVCAVQATAAEIVPRIVAKFGEKRVRITYGLTFEGSNDVIRHLADGEADIGISFNSYAMPNVRHLISVPVPLGAIVHPSHVLARKTTIELQDLIGVPLVLPSGNISTRVLIDDLIRGTTFELEPLITSSSPEFIFSAVMFGAGVGFQTPIGIERELRDRSLVFLPLMDRRLVVPELTVSISSRRPLSTMSSMVAEAARTVVAELLA